MNTGKLDKVNNRFREVLWYDTTKKRKPCLLLKKWSCWNGCLSVPDKGSPKRKEDHTREIHWLSVTHKHSQCLIRTYSIVLLKTVFCASSVLYMFIVVGWWSLLGGPFVLGSLEELNQNILSSFPSVWPDVCVSGFLWWYRLQRMFVCKARHTRVLLISQVHSWSLNKLL